MTVFPAIAERSVTRKAPETVFRRCSGLMPLSGGVRRMCRRSSGSAAILSRRESSLATSADWLKPRAHSRVRWSGTDKDRIAVGLHQRTHIMRHRRCDRDLAAIFEPDRQTSRQRVISDGSARPCDPRRSREAPRAGRLLGRLQRQSATGTAVLAQELDLLPAVRAKAVDVLDDRAATRAARRKREIERRPGAGARKGPEAVHCLLVACLGASHKRGPCPSFST